MSELGLCGRGGCEIAWRSAGYWIGSGVAGPKWPQWSVADSSEGWVDDLPIRASWISGQVDRCTRSISSSFSRFPTQSKSSFCLTHPASIELISFTMAFTITRRGRDLHSRPRRDTLSPPQEGRSGRGDPLRQRRSGSSSILIDDSGLSTSSRTQQRSFTDSNLRNDVGNAQRRSLIESEDFTRRASRPLGERSDTESGRPSKRHADDGWMVSQSKSVCIA